MPSDEDVTTRAGSLQALTGLTDQEFQALLPHFEQAFVAYMQAHTIVRLQNPVGRNHAKAAKYTPVVSGLRVV